MNLRGREWEKGKEGGLVEFYSYSFILLIEKKKILTKMFPFIACIFMCCFLNTTCKVASARYTQLRFGVQILLVANFPLQN